jgi:hypothetical protein
MVYLMTMVLIKITRLLSTTDLKDSVLPQLNETEAEKVLADFSDDEISNWKTAIVKGVTSQDWADLIAHRASQFAS